MSNQDEIRARRLAKMAGKPRQPREAASEKPQPAAQPAPKKVVHEAEPQKPDKKARRAPKRQEDLGEWTDVQLQRILRVSTSEAAAEHNKRFVVRADDEDIGIKLTKEAVDPVFLQLLTETGVAKYYRSPMDYLYDVWGQADSTKGTVRADDPDKAAKVGVIDQVIRLATGYAAILFQIPDMFVDGVELPVLVGSLWRQIGERESFFIDTVSRAVENDSVVDLLNGIIPQLTQQLVTLESTGDLDYLKVLTVVQVLLNNKQVAARFHEIEDYHPAGLKGVEFEQKTVLGRILRISPLLPSIAYSNFPGGMSKADIFKTRESLQAEHSLLVGRLFSICDHLVRASATSRNEFLYWCADVVNQNHLRRGEHAQPENLASDSLMLNVTLILVRFSQPFLAGGSLTAARMSKIAIDYLNHTDENKMLDLSEETKINSTIEEYNEYYTDDKTVDRPLNFISQCFYLLLTYVQYGLGGVLISADRTRNYIKQMGMQLKKFDDMMQKAGGDPSLSNNPMIKMLYESRIQPLRKRLDQLKAVKLSIEMFFYNRNMQLDVFEVIVGAITFFMKLMDPSHKYPETPLKVPFHDYHDDTDKMEDIEYTRTLAPVPFKFFPEMFLEGIINYCHYISKFNNNPMFHNPANLERFVEFAVVILRCPELVSNPHLKARLTEVLFFGSLPSPSGQEGYMVNVFTGNTLVKQNLMVSLLDFYVMVEKTGASSQFYDKFNSRYHISFILEQMWKFDYFRQDLKHISQTMPHLFVRLIARMLNDTTYLLDESLNHLHTIGACQREIENRRRGGEKTMEEEDGDLQKKLEDSERMAKSFVQLSSKTVLLFNLFTKETPRAFVVVELAGRLAGMLDYNLVALVGPRYNELKVRNPETYQFNPGELLFQLCSIFNNLSGEDEFVKAVADDDRSFRPECFQKAISNLYKVGKVPNKEFEETLLGFAARAQQKKKEEEEEELELGEPPDEFLDPLMYTLMRDPVKLPHSKVSVDRSVIKAHLMNDPTDPFNRTPLKIEDVSDDVELRDKINGWIKDRKAQIRAKKAGQSTAKDADGDIELS